MVSVIDHLHDLYAHTDDPWHFATSPYEQAKFRATRGALGRDRYAAALEIGCGNGSLAQHLAPVCDSYTGMDAVEKAVAAARIRVPAATFVQGIYPCPLPVDRPDLVILSEVLYFLTPDVIRHLASDLIDRATGAEVLCVSYLGDTAQGLQGIEALTVLQTALHGHLHFTTVVDADGYRIDRGTINGRLS